MSILTWIEDKKRRNLLNAPNYVARSADASKGLWTRCDKCGVILYIKHLKENQRVCFGCSYHLQMMSQERIENLLDKVPSNSSRSSSSFRAVSLGQKGGRQESLRSRTPRSSYRDDIVSTWRPLDETLSPCDPLKFHDQKNYTDRLKDAQERTGLQDAIQTGTGMIDGIPVALAVMDFSFMGGSMGSVVGEKITRLIEYATAEGLTLLIVSASGGARMQEGVFSLMQMAKVSSALQIYQSCAKLLYISILTSPTTGGVTASFAMLGDIIFAEPKALIAFAGRRVIEQTLAEDLPEDFQTSESMLHHGLVDLIVPRRFLRQALSETIRLYQNAPFKKVGIIPFGVQNPISFLAEEKVRRQWSPLTKLGTKQFVKDASKGREEKRHGAYREILTSFEMMLDLFRSGKGIKMGVTDLTTQKEQAYLTSCRATSYPFLPLLAPSKHGTVRRGDMQPFTDSLTPALAPFQGVKVKGHNGRAGVAPRCTGTGQSKGARRGMVRTAKICTQISFPFAVHPLTPKSLAKAKLTPKGVRVRAKPTCPSTSCPFTFTPWKGASAGASTGIGEGARRRANLHRSPYGACWGQGQRAYPFLSRRGTVRQLPVPIFDSQRGTHCKKSMAHCKGSKKLYSKTTRVFLRQNVSAVAVQSAQNGSSPTNRALSFFLGENKVKNGCRFFNGVQKRLYRKLAQDVYNLRLQNRDDSVNRNGAVPRPSTCTLLGCKGEVAKRGNFSARNAFSTSISVPIFFSVQPFDLQSGLAYKSSSLAEQSKKVDTPIGLAKRKLALARKLVGENARPLQKENSYKKRILFSKDVALFVANKKWTRDLPGPFSSVSSKESMPYKSSRVPCVPYARARMRNHSTPRPEIGEGAKRIGERLHVRARQGQENWQRETHVYPTCPFTEGVGARRDTTRTVSKAFRRESETNIACKMENRFTLLHDFRSFSERLASNKLSREEKNDNRFSQAPKENLPSRANQIKDLHGQVLQARQNKITDSSGKNADINFLNRAIELAATDSVEWRAFYIHQQLSENMGFLEEFLQQDHNSRRKNGNLLFYKSICRTQKALDT